MHLFHLMVLEKFPLMDTYWEMHNSSFNNLKKEIPFFKYLLELGSLT